MDNDYQRELLEIKRLDELQFRKDNKVKNFDEVNSYNIIKREPIFEVVRLNIDDNYRIRQAQFDEMYLLRSVRDLMTDVKTKKMNTKTRAYLEKRGYVESYVNFKILGRDIILQVDENEKSRVYYGLSTSRFNNTNTFKAYSIDAHDLYEKHYKKNLEGDEHAKISW